MKPKNENAKNDKDIVYTSGVNFGFGESYKQSSVKKSDSSFTRRSGEKTFFSGVFPKA
jgi:hypothetical protein